MTTAVNSFHPALKYTWEISDTSLALLDINFPSKATVYAPVCTTNPQILIFICCIHLCSEDTGEDSDFSLKSEEMCDFFDKRGYPVSIVQADHHRAQQIDRQSALQTSWKENNNGISFTLTFHPHNHVVKFIILKNFKLLQNDPDTGIIFSQPSLISFKRDKNMGNYNKVSI